MPSNKQPIEILKNIYGYTSFRFNQFEIIQALVSGDHVFALMPTGGGKSICYQIPAMLRQGIGIVISPLIALMQDQVLALSDLGVSVATINSNTPQQIINATMLRMRNNEIDLVYVSPERLLTDSFIALLNTCEIALFAIDEAHCVSQWGHDFRKEYMKLDKLAELFPHTPRIALTATADKLTRKDIIEKLSLQNGQHFISSFDRPNIQYRIAYKDEPRRQLLGFLEEFKDAAGIVYCLSRKKVEQISDFLNDNGYSSYAYHAGMNSSDREKAHNAFLKDENVIVVATIAFGMGIDKPDVRFIVHMDLPKSIESYYQETGRAGRDGLPAVAWMTYGLSDAVQQRRFIEQSDSDEKQKYIQIQKLNTLIGYSETANCRRQILLRYFDEDSKPCRNCDTCLNPPKTIEGKIPAQMILSAVLRTKEKFGGAHIVDILTGKITRKIVQFDHDKLKTFGIGTQYSKIEWTSFVRQLVVTGILHVNIEGHGNITFTEKSKAVLKGESAIKFTFRTDSYSKQQSNSLYYKKQQSAYNFNVQEKALVANLKKQRAQFAKEKNVSSFMILHDKTIFELVDKKPISLKDLKNISGFGQFKIKQYGQAFINIINEFQMDNIDQPILF